MGCGVAIPSLEKADFFFFPFLFCENEDIGVSARTNMNSVLFGDNFVSFVTWFDVAGGKLQLQVRIRGDQR